MNTSFGLLNDSKDSNLKPNELLDKIVVLLTAQDATFFSSGESQLRMDMAAVLAPDLSNNVQAGQDTDYVRGRVKNALTGLSERFGQWVNSSDSIFSIYKSARREIYALYTPDALFKLRQNGGPPLPSPSPEIQIISVRLR